MVERSVATAARPTTHRVRRPEPHSTHEYGKLPLGRSAHPRRVAEAGHRSLRTDGLAVSADRTRGRSQTWRTFLTNHVGDFICSSAVASSELPGDDNVVDIGLFSFGLTPTSGTAGRLQPHGDYRLLSFGSTHVPSLAAFLGPTFTTGHGQASSGRAPPSHCGRDWPNAYTRRLLRPAVLLRPGGTDRPRRLVRHQSWIAIGQFGTPRAASSINVATQVTRRARSARPRASL